MTWWLWFLAGALVMGIVAFVAFVYWLVKGEWWA